MRHLLEPAAFLLPTITSRFFDGAAFISPFPPLIQQTFTIMKQERAHGDKTPNKPILGFCAFLFRDVFCSPNAPVSDKVNVNQNPKETPWRTPASRTTHHDLQENICRSQTTEPFIGFNTPHFCGPRGQPYLPLREVRRNRHLQPMFAVVKMWYMTAASI